MMSTLFILKEDPPPLIIITPSPQVKEERNACLYYLCMFRLAVGGAKADLGHWVNRYQWTVIVLLGTMFSSITDCHFHLSKAVEYRSLHLFYKSIFIL